MDGMERGPSRRAASGGGETRMSTTERHAAEDLAPGGRVAGARGRGWRRGARHLALGVCLLVGLSPLAIGAVTPAHAAAATIATCDETTLRNAISAAAGGDTLAFG